MDITRRSIARAGGNRSRLPALRLPGLPALRLPGLPTLRLPGAGEPAPRDNHLAGVCVWATALCLGGLAVALRALVGMVWQDRGWYVPTLTLIGTAGIGCTIAAFASVRRRRLAVVLLGLATTALVTGWIVTGR